ncbi:TIGR04211 family SH3 domain-containing protein [Alteromonas sp. 5E99-2]|uniref:TIGR04211 family SH3 domain-containing protein n=1 Tax=Alteromonas sp. 5E99-2 TaxID=2817683 RepID=UPI001A998992|nr:TIGR04211 family SH3 domain-containing protein [Alteromonas sp. 5E99-2]MBO1256625.1 TIGR04211 family SH3 domain-containing protein [Alteromonas sp. 5E99-2]
MRVVFSILVLFLLSSSSHALQQESASEITNTHFISDDLFIFIHAGPGRNYRILGSVDAGDPVNRTDENITDNYVQIVDKNGRTGWIEAKYLSEKISRQLEIEQLREKLEQATIATNPIRQQLANVKKDFESLETDNADLLAELEDTKVRLTAATSKLNEQSQTENLRVLMVGGGLVVGGLLLGVIIAYLPKRRNRNDGWMN